MKIPCQLSSIMSLHLVFTSSVLLVALHSSNLFASASTSSSPAAMCLSDEEVNCLLLDSEQQEELEGFLPSCGVDALKSEPIQRQGIILGRLRFPGTASTHQYEQFRQYEQQQTRFAGISKANHCPTSDLCFIATYNESSTNENDLSLALQQIHLTGFGSHSAYDTVESTLERVANQNGAKEFYMVTTLREPGSYAPKWYAFRRAWDAVLPELAGANFEEWLDLAPWRMNILTRMLGVQPDRLAMPEGLLYTKSGATSGGSTEHDHEVDVFIRDEYMIKQNELGPKESEVYAAAVERLNEMVHFGLFHRLSDTWKLMEHTFCWTMGYQSYRPDKEITGYDALKRHLVPPGQEANATDEATARIIWNKLKKKNRLDLALMEEAERIFDQRLAKMQRERADGILCNFLGKEEVRCADGDDASDKWLRRHF